MRIAIVAALAVGGIAGPPRILFADSADDFAVALKLYKSKRYDLAADGFSDFITKYANDRQRPVAELYLGQSLMHLRKFKESRETFSRFLAANAEHPDRPLAMYRLGECSFFLNEPQQAQAAFTDFLSKYPENELAAWAWHYLGESRLQLEENAGALEAFTAAVEKFPKSTLVRESKLGMARANEALKNVDAAVAIYRELSEDPDNPRAADALFHIGTLLYDKGDDAEAAAVFAKVRERFPQSSQAPRAELNAGFAWFRLGEYDKAIATLKSAAASPSEELQSRLWIGLSHKAKGEYPEAIATLKEASEKFTEGTEAEKLQFHWADSVFRSGDAKNAIPLYVQVSDRFPEGKMADRALHLAVEASLQAGDLEQAEKLHERLTTQYPESRLGMLESLMYGRVLLAKAELAGLQPLSEEAKALIQSAAEQFRTVSKGSQVPGTRDWGRLLLGRSQQLLGENQAAIEALKPLVDDLKQADKSGELTDALLIYGTAAAQASEWTEAESALEKYLTLSPQGRDAAAALSQLSAVKVQLGKEAELEKLFASYSSAGVSEKAMADAIHRAAELSFEQQRWSQAETLFKQLDSLKDVNGYHAIALSGIGHSAYNLQRYPDAAAAFTKLIEEASQEDPKLTADASFMRGLTTELNGQVREAAEIFRNGALQIAGVDGAITAAPSDPEIATNVYRCLLHAARAFAKAQDADLSDKSYSDAWTVLQELPDERKIKESDKLLNEWAIVNYHAERFARSDELFGRLANEFPQSEFNDDARQYLAESLIQEEKYDEAEELLKKLIAEPGIDEFVKEASLVNLMDLAARKEDWKSSGEYAQTILDLPSPVRRLDAQYRKGEAALRTNDFEAARVDLARLRESLTETTEGLKSFPWAEGVWLLLAEAELQLKNYSNVDALVAEFHQHFPQSKVAYQLDHILGRSLTRRVPAEFEKSREVLQQVVDSPDGAKTRTAAQAQFEIAESFLMQKDHASAIREYYKAALGYEFPDIQSAAYFQAGQCEEVLAKVDGALKTYQELVDKFPETEYAAKAKERLAALKPATP